MPKERARLHTLSYFREGFRFKGKGIEIPNADSAVGRIRESLSSLLLPCQHCIPTRSVFLLSDGTVQMPFSERYMVKGGSQVMLSSLTREGVEILAEQTGLPYDAEQVEIVKPAGRTAA